MASPARTRYLPRMLKGATGLWAALVLVRLLLPSIAVAQCPAELRDVPTHVLLARTCVSERGWRAETNDCAAIAEVAQLYAVTHAVPVRSALCALSPTLHGADEEAVGRRWLRDLAADGHRPRHLRVAWEAERCSAPRVSGRCPAGHALPARRDVWLATVAEAEALLTSARNVCAEPPRTWGSDSDLARRRRTGFGWREVDCGLTVNHFGVVLRRR